jgi:hypothetical protein
LRLWLGAKGTEKKRMSEEGFQFRHFQSAGIGARGARLNYKPHLKGKENEKYKSFGSYCVCDGCS